MISREATGKVQGSFRALQAEMNLGLSPFVSVQMLGRFLCLRIGSFGLKAKVGEMPVRDSGANG